jgi:hypothetical protein
MKLIARVFLVLAALAAVTGCTMDEYKAHMILNGHDPSQYSEAELQANLDAYNRFQLEQADLHKFDWVLSDGQLANLRWCESTGNYNAVSPGGAYRGAYQFSQSTWDWVASTHHPRFVGHDPRWAAPDVQDAMARALWLMMGPSPWPVCGYRV